MYTVLVFLHLAGVLGFLLAHGTSLSVTLRLRRETSPQAMRAMLDLSAATRPLMYGSLALLLLGGVTAGFMGHWWGFGWIWAALGVLVAITVAALLLGRPYFTLARRIVAAGKKPTPAQLQALRDAPQPILISAVGIIGLLVILWLMVAKPF